MLLDLASGFRASVARWLKVPPEPEPPAGGAGSLRRFRASPNYLKYRLVQWGIKQLFAIWGLLFGLIFVTRFDQIPFVFEALEILAWVGFVFQFFFTLAMVFVDWDLRWYLVTDRSLRIREGVGKVTEKTQSFANIQNLSIRRGPLQRLLGIADVEVRTAGGGGGSAGEKKEIGKEDLHSAYFRGVDNAEEIRDVILTRLRRFRDAGLGDPDEPQRVEPSVPTDVPTDAGQAVGSGLPGGLHRAICDLAIAVRELRLQRRSSPGGRG